MKNVLLGVVLALVPFLGISAEDQANKPEWRVGDKWVYESLRENLVTAEVLEATPGGYKVKLTLSKSGTVRFDTLNQDLNLVERNGRQFTPAQTNWNFPLVPGKSWTGKYQYTHGETGAPMNAARTTRVVGWEEVVVPAGKFRVLKVDHETRYENLSTRFTQTMVETYWYSPEVRRHVRYTLLDHGSRLGSNTDIKLLKHEPAPSTAPKSETAK